MANVLTSMIFSGVLEHYPRIRLVLGESGIGWIPYVLWRMDAEWEDQFKDLSLKMPPSEYWKRQCWATYQTDPIGVKLLDELGADKVMWGSDFPHPDGVWPDSQEYIERELGHLPADVRRKIVCENAAHALRLPALASAMTVLRGRDADRRHRRAAGARRDARRAATAASRASPPAAGGPWPAAHEVIDATGLTVLPGLIDCHDHLAFHGYELAARWGLSEPASTRSCARPASSSRRWRPATRPSATPAGSTPASGRRSTKG